MLNQPYRCDDVHMPRPATGETPKRNIRIENEIWDPAKDRALAERQTLTKVVKSYLARYGAKLSDEAPEADPWDIVNLAISELGAGKVGPNTDLAMAVDAAADMLRALGIRPVPRQAADEAGGTEAD